MSESRLRGRKNGQAPYNTGTAWQHTMALENAAAIQYVVAELFEAQDF